MKKTILIYLIVGISLMIGFLTIKSKTPIGLTCSFIDEAGYANQKGGEGPTNYPVEIGIPINIYGQMR